MRIVFRILTVFIFLWINPHGAHAVRPTRFCLGVLDRIKSLNLPTPAEQPPMMAIGDSLYNGVTSLTIDGPRANHGPPALIARALQQATPPFKVPAYPEPILFNFERGLEEPLPDLVAEFGPDVQKNINYWIHTFPAHVDDMPDYFDDLAVAQANSVQLMCDTASQQSQWVKNTPINPGLFNIPANIASWYYALNSRFILDPKLTSSRVSGLPQELHRDSLSQLAQVMVRQPARLLLEIGQNDGVWLMAFRGIGPDQPYTPLEFSQAAGRYVATATTTTMRKEMVDLVENMKLIAGQIPKATKHIYLNNMPPPSRTANLTPDGNELKNLTGACELPAAGDSSPTTPYFAYYVNYLTDTPGQINVLPGEKVCAMDQLVNETNAKIKNAMSEILGNRLVVVDIYDLLMKYDGKHLGAGHGIKVDLSGAFGFPWPVELDNRIVNAGPVFGGIISGGLMGYDNMHPTWVGYSLVAKAVLDAIQETEGVTFDYNLISPQAVVDELEAQKVPSALLVGPTQASTLSLIHGLLSQLHQDRFSRTRDANVILQNIMKIAVGPSAPTR